MTETKLIYLAFLLIIFITFNFIDMTVYVSTDVYYFIEFVLIVSIIIILVSKI